MLSNHLTQFCQHQIAFPNRVSKKDLMNSRYATRYRNTFDIIESSPMNAKKWEIHLVFNFIFEFLLCLITNHGLINQTNNHSKTASIRIVRHETFVMAAHSVGFDQLTIAIGCKLLQIINKWFKLIFVKVCLIHRQYEYVNTIIFWWNFRSCCWWFRSCNIDILAQLVIQNDSSLKNKITFMTPHLGRLISRKM